MRPLTFFGWLMLGWVAACGDVKLADGSGGSGAGASCPFQPVYQEGDDMQKCVWETPCPGGQVCCLGGCAPERYCGQPGDGQYFNDCPIEGMFCVAADQCQPGGVVPFQGSGT